METFSALLAFCAGNSPVIGEFPAHWPVTRSFDVFFHLCLNKLLSKQSWGWWFETPSRSLRRHCNDYKKVMWLSYFYMMGIPILIRRRLQIETGPVEVIMWVYRRPQTQVFHDDVIKWKHFPRYWPFVREFTGRRWIPRTKASDAELWCFFLSASE